MRLTETSLAMMAGITLAAVLPQAALGAQQAHDHDHASGAAELRLDQGGKKWASDDALRQGMNAIRDELAANLAAIHEGRLPPEKYAALGRIIEARVGDIVAQCRLEPKADAVLHVVIHRLLAAAEVMQGKAKGKPAAAAHQAVEAVNAYGRHFDHPQWQPIR